MTLFVAVGVLSYSTDMEADALADKVGVVNNIEVQSTNVVTELDTLCSSTVQFGLITNHSLVSNGDITQLTSTIYEIDNEEDLCHVTRSGTNYVCEGYYDMSDLEGVFQIGVDPIWSMWCPFNKDSTGVCCMFVNDMMVVSDELDYINTALALMQDKDNMVTTAARHGDYYTFLVDNYDDLPAPSTPSDVISCTCEVFIPNESSDTQSYKIRYSYVLEDSMFEVQEEFYQFEVMLDVGYKLEYPTQFVAESTRVFEYVYNWLMR